MFGGVPIEALAVSVVAPGLSEVGMVGGFTNSPELVV
jgi:hypothetical protein